MIPIVSLTRIRVTRLIVLSRVVSFEPPKLKTAHLVTAPVVIAYTVRASTKESDLVIAMRNISWKINAAPFKSCP